ncbi:MAG: hypothetical protein DRN35_06835, partial [Thermoplasmata archaeon]
IYLEGKEGRYNFSWEVQGSALRIYDVEMGGRKGFKEGDRVVLHVEGVEDLSGNPMAPCEHEIKVEGKEEPAPAYAYLILIVAIIFVAAVLTTAVIKMKRRGEGKGSAEE